MELSPAIRSALRELREELASELRTAVEKVERAQPQAHAASPAGTSGVPEEVRAELSEIKALLRSSQQARAATSAHNVRYGARGSSTHHWAPPRRPEDHACITRR